MREIESVGIGGAFEQTANLEGERSGEVEVLVTERSAETAHEIGSGIPVFELVGQSVIGRVNDPSVNNLAYVVRCCQSIFLFLVCGYLRGILFVLVGEGRHTRCEQRKTCLLVHTGISVEIHVVVWLTYTT